MSFYLPNKVHLKLEGLDEAQAASEEACDKYSEVRDIFDKLFGKSVEVELEINQSNKLFLNVTGLDERQAIIEEAIDKLCEVRDAIDRTRRIVTQINARINQPQPQ